MKRKKAAPLFSSGVDVVGIERIAEAIKNPRFVKRVFTPKEIRYCRSHANPALHFAARFAAKEAVWKALSDVGAALSWQQIEVIHLKNGRPTIKFPKKYAAWEQCLSLSISHEKSVAIAFAIFAHPKK